MPGSTLVDVKVDVTLAAKSRNADADGTGIDLQNRIANRKLRALLDVGTPDADGGTLNVKIQESDDDVTYTDISGAAFTQVTSAASTQNIYFLTNKRYVRALGDVGGTTPVFDYGVYIISHGRNND